MERVGFVEVRVSDNERSKNERVTDPEDELEAFCGDADRVRVLGGRGVAVAMALRLLDCSFVIEAERDIDDVVSVRRSDLDGVADEEPDEDGEIDRVIESVGRGVVVGVAAEVCIVIGSRIKATKATWIQASHLPCANILQLPECSSCLKRLFRVSLFCVPFQAAATPAACCCCCCFPSAASWRQHR
jgi:hypothetical protein